MVSLAQGQTVQSRIKEQREPHACHLLEPDGCFPSAGIGGPSCRPELEQAAYSLASPPFLGQTSPHFVLSWNTAGPWPPFF